MPRSKVHDGVQRNDDCVLRDWTHLNQQTHTDRCRTGTCQPSGPKSPLLNRSNPRPLVVVPSGKRTTGPGAWSQSSFRLYSLVSLPDLQVSYVVAGVWPVDRTIVARPTGM